MALPIRPDHTYDPLTDSWRPSDPFGTQDRLLGRPRDPYTPLVDLIDRTPPASDGRRWLGVVVTRRGHFNVVAIPASPPAPPATPRDLPAEWSFLP